jgi:hypothetical protein
LKVFLVHLSLLHFLNQCENWLSVLLVFWSPSEGKLFILIAFWPFSLVYCELPVNALLIFLFTSVFSIDFKSMY